MFRVAHDASPYFFRAFAGGRAIRAIGSRCRSKLSEKGMEPSMRISWIFRWAVVSSSFAMRSRKTRACTSISRFSESRFNVLERWSGARRAHTFQSQGRWYQVGEMERSQRRNLRTINGRLKKIAQFYKKSRYLLKSRRVPEAFTRARSAFRAKRERGMNGGGDHDAWLAEALLLAERAASEDEVQVVRWLLRKDSITGEAVIVGRGYDRRGQDEKPHPHAEILAIQDAARSTGHWRLNDCILYVTLEPCPMCLAACQQARIESVIFGANDPKGGAWSLGYPLHEDVRTHHRFSVELRKTAECGRSLTRFFSASALDLFPAWYNLEPLKGIMLPWP